MTEETETLKVPEIALLRDMKSRGYGQFAPDRRQAVEIAITRRHQAEREAEARRLVETMKAEFLGEQQTLLGDDNALRAMYGRYENKVEEALKAGIDVRHAAERQALNQSADV